MRRTIWFSSICLIAVALVAGGKILLSAIKPWVKVIEKYEPTYSKVGPKGDKLEVEAKEEVPERIPVKTVKVVPDAEPSRSDKSESVAATQKWRPAFASVRQRVRHVHRRHRWHVRRSQR